MDDLKKVISILSIVSTQLEAIKNISMVPCILSKEHLTVAETCTYLSMSRENFYHISKKDLPRYKPGGKVTYIKRADLIFWIESNLIKSDEEIDQQATAYNNKKKGGVP